MSYKPIDVDNHYYEPLDASTRHLDKEFKHRGVQMVTQGKRAWAAIGDRVNHFIPNPTFDPIIVPGCLDLLFRGEIPEGVDPSTQGSRKRAALSYAGRLREEQFGDEPGPRETHHRLPVAGNAVR